MRTMRTFYRHVLNIIGILTVVWVLLFLIVLIPVKILVVPISVPRDVPHAALIEALLQLALTGVFGIIWLVIWYFLIRWYFNYSLRKQYGNMRSQTTNGGSAQNYSEIVYRPIGIIHTPFKEPRGVPIQPKYAKGIRGTVEVFPEYAEGLQDIEGFSHIILIYHFHLAKRKSLKVVPFLDTKPRGIFATRAPRRPNPIGVSVVRLLKVEGNILHVENVDIVDGTPLLDIKPYVPEFDAAENVRIGWLEERVKRGRLARDDGRFMR